MNKRQRLVQERFLDNEDKIISLLDDTYNTALDDITDKVSDLDKTINHLQKVYAGIDDDGTLTGAALKYFGKTSIVDVEATKETLASMLQSKVYQKNYQTALKKQVSGVLDKMHKKEYTAVSDYLNECYEDAFVGTMFDLHGQGIPLIMPINQENVVRAVQLESKISKGLYNRIGENVADLKKIITAEVSRGIVNGSSYEQIAQQIRFKMVGTYDKVGGALYRSQTIARTEGHRIQATSAMDACTGAKEKGADVVKQWDSALDKRTRESHREVDGEIRELDEPFSNGLMFPGDPDGGAAEVVNCRCALLQRARWELDDEELETLKKRAEYFGLDKSKNFEDFKKKYLKSVEPSAKMEAENISVECQRLVDGLDNNGVDFKWVEKHDSPLSEEEIINALSGGDRTRGSCASVGLAYCGQKGGLNVLDFRDGKSRDFFSRKYNIRAIAELPGVKTITAVARSSVTAGNKLLKQVEKGKEYYLVCGRHAAIVRKTADDILQYLELQSATRSGWQNFDENPRHTLKWRFGENKGYDVEDFMIEVDSIKDSDDLKKLLGYLNTAESEQRKGKHGTIK